MNTEYDYLYVGTYTSKEAPGCNERDVCGRGIYRFECQKDGIWNWYSCETEKDDDQNVFPAYNPSYLELDREEKYLYAVEEMDDHGTILCYQVMEDGRLEFLERYFFRGGASCHIMVTRDNRFLVVSDYGAGCITIFERREDGRLKYVKQHQQEGQGLRKERQEAPHAHSTLELPNGSIVVADLGTDRLTVLERIVLTMDEEPVTVWHETTPLFMPEGSGPRHMVLSPNGRFLYVLTELSCEVCIVDLKHKNNLVGRYSVRYRVAGGEYSGNGVMDETTENLSADIHISEDGEHLYVSNRGLDTIVIFTIAEGNGQLALQGVYPCGGKNPRNFALTKEHIVIANQATSNVVIYRLNPFGNLGLPVGELHVPKASCVLLLKNPEKKNA